MIWEFFNIAAKPVSAFFCGGLVFLIALGFRQLRVRHLGESARVELPQEDLPRFYVALAEGRGEFINGCRLVYQQEDQAMRHLNLIANKFFGLAFSYVLNQRLKAFFPARR